MMALGKHDEAYAMSSVLIRQNQSNSSLLITRARCLYLMGNLDSAVKHLQVIAAKRRRRRGRGRARRGGGGGGGGGRRRREGMLTLCWWGTNGREEGGGKGSRYRGQRG